MSKIHAILYVFVAGLGISQFAGKKQGLGNNECCRVKKIQPSRETLDWDSYFYNCTEHDISEVPHLLLRYVIDSPGYQVDCSNCALNNTPGNISGVHPDMVVILNLTNNFIEQLGNEDLYMYKNLQVLDLSNNLINTIYGTVFNRLDRLKILQLRGANRGDTSQKYTEILNASFLFRNLNHLQSLDMSNQIQQGFRFEHVLLALNSTSLENLEVLLLDQIHSPCFEYVPWIIGPISATSLDHKKLKVLSLQGNIISGFFSDVHLPADLRWISLRKNTILIHKFIFFRYHNLSCIDFGRQAIDSVLQNCKSHPFMSQLYNSYGNITVLPFLRFLKLDHYPLGATVVYSPKLCLQKKYKLEYIDLSYSKIANISGTLCIIGLKYLDITGMEVHYFSLDFFQGLPDLQSLKLGRIFTRIPIELENQNASNIFKFNRNLINLDLSSNNIKHLWHRIFRNLSKLEHLDLQGNILEGHIFNPKGLKSLKVINLSKNRFHSLDILFLDQLEKVIKRRNITLKLDENPLVCSCTMLPYLRKLYLSKINVPISSTCSLQNGTVLSVKEATKYILKSCMKNFYFVYAFYSISLGIITVTAVIIRNRWRLEYLALLAKQLTARKQEKNRDDLEFDAFISYHNTDLWWLLGEVLPNLGNDQILNALPNIKPCKTRWPRYHFCVDQWHFVPGIPIIDNIVTAINSSRCTILFLTPKFIKSHWCQMETKLSVSAYNKKIIAVVHPKIAKLKDQSRLPVTLQALLNYVTYIEWPLQEKERPLFWMRLSIALGQPIGQAEN